MQYEPAGHGSEMEVLGQKAPGWQRLGSYTPCGGHHLEVKRSIAQSTVGGHIWGHVQISDGIELGQSHPGAHAGVPVSGNGTARSPARQNVKLAMGENGLLLGVPLPEAVAETLAGLAAAGAA